MDSIFYTAFVDEMNKIAMKAPLTMGKVKALPGAPVGRETAKAAFTEGKAGALPLSREEKRQSKPFMQGALQFHQARKAGMSGFGTREPVPGGTLAGAPA